MRRLGENSGYRFFFVFFERDGITLATVLTIDVAILATTPFFDLRVPLEEDRFAFDFGAALDFDFALDFVAVFAIADSATPFAFP